MKRLSLHQSLALSTLAPMIVFCVIVLVLSWAWAWRDVLDIAGKRNTSLASVAAAAAAGQEDTGTLCATIDTLSSLTPGRLYAVSREGQLLCPSTAAALSADPCSDFDLGRFLDKEKAALPSAQVGARCLVSYAPVPATSWGVVLEEKRADVVSSTQAFLIAMGALMVVGLFVSFWLLWIVFQRVSWPLLAVTEQARRVADGHAFVPPDVAGPAEVEALVAAFNHMVTLLRQQRDTLQEYAARTLDSQEEERKRISRDLHDETAQQLVGLMQRIDLCRLSAEDNPRVLVALDELGDLTNATLAGVRRMSRALRPLILEDLGLVAAVQTLAEEIEQELPGAQVFCEIIGQEQRLSPEVELTAFRIVQEALTNVRKHASGADRVYVTVQFKAHVLEVSVEDNGQGFHLPGGEPASRGEHLGLIGMQERAELLGGTLAIFAQPGEGTRIVFKLPKTVLSHSLEEQALGHLAPA